MTSLHWQTSLQTQTCHVHCTLGKTDKGLDHFLPFAVNSFRYDSGRGIFTAPVDGWYFVSTFLRGGLQDFSRFDMELNDEIICTATADHDDVDRSAMASCSSVFFASQGT